MNPSRPLWFPLQLVSNDLQSLVRGVECSRNKYGERQEREGDLLSSVTTLEDEKDVLARVLVMAEERYDRLF